MPIPFLLALALLPGAAVAAPPETVYVPAATYMMGNSQTGDDALYGAPKELPRHPVQLSPCTIGKFPVTNSQYSEMLNWALSLGRLESATGGPYDGGDVYTSGKKLLALTAGFYQFSLIEYNGQFVPKVRVSLEQIPYSMQDHPVVNVSWYGAVAFSNWLSEREGLQPCYDLAAWEPIDADTARPGLQFHNGYRLPTEAEWIRAASFDGARYWIYPTMTDTMTSPTCYARANYRLIQEENLIVAVNPLGLAEEPYTSPVGWFNGIRISPNGRVQTIDSPSPVGAYDMQGGVREWCHDFISDDYSAYSLTEPALDPTGPDTGTYKVSHGGSFNTPAQYTRANNRDGDLPADTYLHNGFRIARNAAPSMASEWNLYR